MPVLLGRSCTGTSGGDTELLGVCAGLSPVHPSSHKSPRVAKVTLLATAASLVHFMRRDVISWSDNSPTSTANLEFQEEPQTADACAEPQLGETFEPNAKPQKALFSLFTLGKETRGVRAPWFFSHSQVSQLVDRRGQLSLVRCLGLVRAHSTQLWRSEQMEV